MDSDNPTFSHPEEVLEVMMKRKDYPYFAIRHFLVDFKKLGICVPETYITKPDKLLIAAHKWSMEHREAK